MYIQRYENTFRDVMEIAAAHSRLSIVESQASPPSSECRWHIAIPPNARIYRKSSQCSQVDASQHAVKDGYARSDNGPNLCPPGRNNVADSLPSAPRSESDIILW